MVIDRKNILSLKDIHLHDASFEEIVYNHYENKIIIMFKNEWNDPDYNIEFEEVLYHEMTHCDFWGGGYNVICWSFLDDDEIYDRLLRKDMIESAKSSSSEYTPMDLSGYIGVKILKNSGDSLKIICKRIRVSETKE